jgi:Leucine-rich repeat (LRR) protein
MLFNKQTVKLSQVIESSLCADTKKIALNSKDIEVIDKVSVIYHNCKTLYLNQNRIKSLHGLYQFKNLKNLSLSYNLVSIRLNFLI